MAGRVNPSDVAQEALAEADRRLGPYLRDRPLPFYPWLVQFARDRLIDARRKHLGAAEPERPPRGRARPRLGASGRSRPTPGRSIARSGRERRAVVRSALDRLPRPTARSCCSATSRGSRPGRPPRPWASARRPSRAGTAGPWNGSARCLERDPGGRP